MMHFRREVRFGMPPQVFGHETAISRRFTQGTGNIMSDLRSKTSERYPYERSPPNPQTPLLRDSVASPSAYQIAGAGTLTGNTIPVYSTCRFGTDIYLTKSRVERGGEPAPCGSFASVREHILRNQELSSQKQHLPGSRGLRAAHTARPEYDWRGATWQECC